MRAPAAASASIAGGDHETSEQRLIDLADPEAPPRLVAAREEGVRYRVADRGDELFILTNADGAIDFKIVTAPLAAPERANWRDLIPHRPGIYILDLELYAGHLVRLERANALPSIVIRDLATGERARDRLRRGGLFARHAWAATSSTRTTLRFAYSSMTTPAEVYDYDMATRDAHPAQAPGDPVRATIRPTTSPRASWRRPHDGAEVPVSILHRRGLRRATAAAPLLLYGYGSYGMAMPASFSANRLSLVDRGFVYAIAHIRGGADKGWGWYLDGKREKKTNTLRRLRRLRAAR